MSEFLTKNLFLPLSHLQRKWKRNQREVFAAYREGLRFRRENFSWNDEQKRQWTLQKLRQTLRYAERETAYYQRLFKEAGFDPQADFSFEDFAKLPTLEREHLNECAEDLINRNIPRNELLKDATGGSTGKPTEIWLGAEERGWRESGLEFQLEMVGAENGVKTAYFWGHHLDPQANDNWRERMRSFAFNVRWFDCFRLSPEVFQKYHRELEKWSPDCIIAYASSLGHFAAYLREQKIKPNYPKTCFVTGAEKLFPAHREIIEEVFGKPVHERYGGRDFGSVAMQPNPFKSLNYWVDWSFVLLEPETSEAESPILITKLRADGMPMIRYRVGDVGKFPAGSAAGNPAFSLREVVGRELDFIYLKNGKLVSGAEFPHLLKDFSVHEFQVKQSADYSVELSIVPKNGFDEGEKARILRTVQSNLVELPIELKVVEEIPRTKANKWRPVLSEVKVNDKNNAK